MASASIEDKGGGRWRIRWREKRPEGNSAQPEVTVHGSAEDAEAYRLVVIRDLRERGHHDPAVQRARHAPPATYRATVPLLAEAIHEVTRIPETAPLPVTLLNRRLFDARSSGTDDQRTTPSHSAVRDFDNRGRSDTLRGPIRPACVNTTG
ncbi:MAG: hypothetical protein EXR69_10640 [Myxococcales bacterium]|nr:hypothetical protein [Myxococcales bacterium]